jgi:MYXO-CTERM domain-containing protein
VIRYEDFRVTETTECNGTSVEMVNTVQGELQVPFAFSLAEDAEPGLPMEEGDLYPAGHYVLATLVEITTVDMACAPNVIGYAYDASVAIASQAGGNGSQEIVQVEGRAAWRDPAGTSDLPIGAWEMSAVDYTRAPAVCESEPLQGTLTVRAGGEEITVRPDGATSCEVDDEPPCAPWSRNGQDQPGPICNYAGCSAGPDAPPPWVALAILLAGLLWQRRRTRDRSRTRG